MSKTGAGQLHERVAWDMRAPIDDGHGNSVAGFVEQFLCRAGFTYLRGGEAVLAGRLAGRQPIVVRVRASTETRQIQPDWRMRDTRSGEWADSGETVWSGPTYAVRSVAETPDRRWLDILVEQGVAA